LKLYDTFINPDFFYVYEMLEGLLNPILYPLLKLGYTWALVVISLLVALLITLIYKYTTNQSLMKDLKGELKAFQKEIKELKNDPKKAMSVQKEMMQTNMKYMMHSFKPMLFTFLPIILIFGWMNVHIGYYPIMPDQEFSVTLNFNDGASGYVELIAPEGIIVVNGINQEINAKQVTFFMKGMEGKHAIGYEFNGDTYYNDILITYEKEYVRPDKSVRKNDVKTIKTNLEPVLPLNLGFHKFGWLGSYIIFSMIFSSILRKLMKVY